MKGKITKKAAKTQATTTFDDIITASVSNINPAPKKAITTPIKKAAKSAKKGNK